MPRWIRSIVIFATQNPFSIAEIYTKPNQNIRRLGFVNLYKISWADIQRNELASQLIAVIMWTVFASNVSIKLMNTIWPQWQPNESKMSYVKFFCTQKHHFFERLSLSTPRSCSWLQLRRLTSIKMNAMMGMMRRGPNSNLGGLRNNPMVMKSTNVTSAICN